MKDQREKICAVIFDEISIAPFLKFNSKKDCIKGLEDLGQKRTPHIANYEKCVYGERHISTVETTAGVYI